MPCCDARFGAMSVFTIVMTVPQIWTIWIVHQAEGFPALSWSAYLVSALLWFWARRAQA
jgi:hypothetical protein